jgi:hypothetical protein
VIWRRVAAGLAVVAVVLLAAAEFTTLFEVTVGSLEVVKRSSTGGANHGYALLVVAVAAAALTLLVLRGGRARPAGGALVALGLATLAIGFAIDLPDTRARGTLPETVSYEKARARAATGLYLELAGGVALLLAGGAIVAPDPPARRRVRPHE